MQDLFKFTSLKKIKNRFSCFKKIWSDFFQWRECMYTIFSVVNWSFGIFINIFINLTNMEHIFIIEANYLKNHYNQYIPSQFLGTAQNWPIYIYIYIGQFLAVLNFNSQFMIYVEISLAKEMWLDFLQWRKFLKYFLW